MDGRKYGSILMRIRHLLVYLLLVGPHAHAQTPACVERESKLKAEISVTNGCEAGYQACLDLGPTNPMRELNYCRNLLKSCQSLNGPIESEALRRQVEDFRKQCP